MHLFVFRIVLFEAFLAAKVTCRKAELDTFGAGKLGVCLYGTARANDRRHDRMVEQACV